MNTGTQRGPRPSSLQEFALVAYCTHLVHDVLIYTYRTAWQPLPQHLARRQPAFSVLLWRVHLRHPTVSVVSEVRNR